MSGIKNADGTVNFAGMKQHLNYVKGKYAQNAENYKKNTGQEMGFGDSKGDSKADLVTSESHSHAKEKHHVAADANSQADDPRTEGDDAPDATQHDDRKND